MLCFCRLSEGRRLGNLTEVPLPVRFIFILMGPSDSTLDYHEIGRSISTLLANTVSIAYCITSIMVFIQQYLPKHILTANVL